MKKMKKITAILLALAMCLAVAACGGGTTPSAEPSTSAAPGNSPAPGASTAPSTSTAPGAGSTLAPGEVIAAPEGEDVKYADLIDILIEVNCTAVDPFNPGASGAGIQNMYVCVYDRLAIRVGEGIYEPELATSWDSADLQTWTFKLRDDVSFHNGAKFTAQDVIDTVMLSRDAPGSYAFDAWRNVETITAIDEYTVQIVLDAVNVDFLFQISLPGASIVNKAARDADPVKGAWIGTGAFFVSDFVSSDYVTLDRNDSYWGTAPITKQLNFRHVPEMTARTLMLQNGESQMCTSVSNEDMDLFVNDPDNFTIYAFPGNTIFTLIFNMNDKITGDLNFRLAVAHALQRPDITIVSAGEWANPITDGTFWGDSTEFRNNDIPMLQYDPELSMKYLEESSYDGQEVELMSALPLNNRMAEVIQEQLARVGINVKLFQTDGPTLQSTTVYGNDRMQMLSYVSAFSLSASTVRNVLYPGGVNNRASYNNPAVNELLDKAPTIADPVERGKLYKQVQEIVSEEIPFISCFCRVFSLVCDSGLGGIIVSPDQTHDFRGIFWILDD